MPDTPLSVEPASPPGRSAGAAGGLLDQLNGFAKNIQYLLDPMATGSNRAMVIAKDAISMVRPRALGSCAYRSGLGEAV